ncbi:SH3 domain-containing protein [Paenibacillus sp. UNC496MF]|uniref:C40 family peptidase n=1 Tax=Paenibacillus sp. UNC496MF TaxID=1502753 RepID=UPI0008EEEFEB|nr:SH3 domain-containing C40 family peptidase [Paenibacillus sp. UNC496MF]SFI87885.1 SH3 domain-containing protein [Paenibacillus sp. UNC496MF]
MKKSTAALLTFVLGASLMLPAAASAASAASPTVGEIQSSVSFRTQPSTSSDVTRYLKQGEQVVILEEVNAYWYKVQDVNGAVGYISSNEKYVEIVAKGGDSGTAARTGTIVASVSFRTGPSTDAPRIRYLAKGEKVTITGQPNSYWYAVTAADGTKGYVSSDDKYIAVTGSLPGNNPSDGNPNNGGGSGNHDALVERVIAAGMKYLGTPYEFGSDRDTTTTFDCSDFVRQAFREGANLLLPVDSRKQGDYVRGHGRVVTDWHQLKRGDIMFFMEYKGTKASAYAGVDKSDETITHCGIYLGNGQILHTYSVESGGVRTSVISGTHWEYRFLFGGSVV